MSTASVTTPVLIAGAGPAGLALALTLLKNGISVRLIDKGLEYHAGQRAIGTSPRTQELWNLLGVLPDIRAASVEPKPVCVYKLPGGREVVKEVTVKMETDPTPGIPYWHTAILGQEHTQSILRSHLAKFDCQVELATELVGFEQHQDHVVAQIRNVQDGSTETVTCRWLVGTDGAKGVVRKLLGLTFLGETREEHKQLFVDLHLKGLDREHWHQWGSLSDNFVFIRPTEYKDDSFSMIASGNGLDVESIVADPDELVTFVRSTTDRDDIELGKIKWISWYRPNIRMVNKFGEGRVFVAGDAAHVHSPAGGQGMNSSIQDAFNLGWKLALVEKGHAPPSLLSTYNDERLPVIAKMLNISTDLLDQAIASESVDESAWDRSGPLLQLGIHYRWSPIVLDERFEASEDLKTANPYGIAGDAVRAGDRAPEAPGLHKIRGPDALGETTSLFRVFSPTYHTILLFTPDGKDLEDIVSIAKHYPTGAIRTAIILSKTGVAPSATPADLVLSDEDGHAHAGYGIGDDDRMVAIVRPDGVVGGFVHGAGGVGRYFDLIFGSV
ncbi:hypothetical protein CERSUDRAFT_118603 [Gelatoporia subvermispora B]|uniref:FAD-binding domain-containing protein n=1 Tax=Ceriporiopsis subvermispora (strain B) TaxID=914234 RepID=M2R113_CERS8|nr:hypothetical protein CERSUDRAFT_118603 [Gelatoporia subvermispora B]